MLLLTIALVEAVDSGGVDVGLFAQYGILGIFALMLVIFAKGAHQRERDRADRLEAETVRLNGIIQDRVIPALTAAARAAEESSELLRAVQRERELIQIAETRHTAKGGS